MTRAHRPLFHPHIRAQRPYMSFPAHFSPQRLIHTHSVVSRRGAGVPSEWLVRPRAWLVSMSSRSAIRVALYRVMGMRRCAVLPSDGRLWRGHTPPLPTLPHLWIENNYIDAKSGVFPVFSLLFRYPSMQSCSLPYCLTATRYKKRGRETTNSRLSPSFRTPSYPYKGIRPSPGILSVHRSDQRSC